MMRTSLSVVVALLLAAGSLAQAQTQTQPVPSAPAPKAQPAAPAPKINFPAASPAATLKQRVGLTDIEIAYSRPGVKGRTIFGGLEPYDQVWRTGANSATKIVFSTPVKFNGTEVPAGTYGLFTIPGREEWTVILNKIAIQWGAYQYDPKDDVLRVKVTPVKLAEAVETFTIDLNDIRDESATLNLTWEKTRVPVKLEVDITSALVAQIDAAMAADGKKPYFQAAMFYLEHNLDLTKAAQWMDAALAENPDAYYMLYHKARLLAKQGDKAAAIATARKSIELASKDTSPAKGEYTRLNETLIASLQ
jgi:tetratricopeptide (TPR) repeat protein